jgi:hypothetical protein
MPPEWVVIIGINGAVLLWHIWMDILFMDLVDKRFKKLEHLSDSRGDTEGK